MGDLKYVMFNDGNRNIPVIFADTIAHISMAELVTNHKDCKSFRVVSAGFIHMNDTVCYGDSSTLNIQSRQEDSEIIQFYPYDHGLGNTEMIDLIKSMLRKLK